MKTEMPMIVGVCPYACCSCKKLLLGEVWVSKDDFKSGDRVKVTIEKIDEDYIDRWAKKTLDKQQNLS